MILPVKHVMVEPPAIAYRVLLKMSTLNQTALAKCVTLHVPLVQMDQSLAALAVILGISCIGTINV